MEHQTLIAEQAPPSASAIVGVSANTSANAGVGGGANATQTPTPTPRFGVPAPSSRPARPESPIAHARRSVGPNHVPPVRIETVTCPTGSERYRLSIVLPRPGGAALATEMITVSARRGGRLAVVADAWHLEHDCK